MSSVRQSSVPRGNVVYWYAAGAGLVQSRTVCQQAGSCGAVQRLSPVGAAP